MKFLPVDFFLVGPHHPDRSAGGNQKLASHLGGFA